MASSHDNFIYRMIKKKSHSVGKIEFQSKNNEELKRLRDKHLFQDDQGSVTASVRQRGSSVTNNINLIQQKSSLKGRVQTYLADHRKMGVLDQKNPIQKKLIAKMTTAVKMLPSTQQSKAQLYLNKLKQSYSEFCNSNSKKQIQIRNLQGKLTQVKQQSIFYKNILSMTLQEQLQQLERRKEKIIWIKYQSDILMFMADRLKTVNSCYKKKINNTLAVLRAAQAKNIHLNEKQGKVKQLTDHKEYAMKLYSDSQSKKNQQILFKKQNALTNLEIDKSARMLEKNYSEIRLIDHAKFRIQTCLENHNKFMSKLRTLMFEQIIMNSSLTKLKQYYSQFQKAEIMMKMRSLDFNFEIKKSYFGSFTLRQDLEKSIDQRQKQIKKLEQIHQDLCHQWLTVGYTGTQSSKVPEINEEQLIQQTKKNARKSHQAVLNKITTAKLNIWLKNQQSKLNILASKKTSTKDRILVLLNKVVEQCRSKQTVKAQK